MLTFVMALAPLIWLASVIGRKESPVDGWNNRKERLQFEEEVNGWKYGALVELP